jgi:hypothetical protein
MKRLLPPVDSSISYVLLRRFPGEQRCLLYLPDGSSYFLSSEEIRRYLSRLGVEDSDSPVDHVWNFYSVIVSIPEGKFECISGEDLLEIARVSREEPDSCVVLGETTCQRN